MNCRKGPRNYPGKLVAMTQKWDEDIRVIKDNREILKERGLKDMTIEMVIKEGCPVSAITAEELAP